MTNVYRIKYLKGQFTLNPHSKSNSCIPLLLRATQCTVNKDLTVLCIFKLHPKPIYIAYCVDLILIFISGMDVSSVSDGDHTRSHHPIPCHPSFIRSHAILLYFEEQCLHSYYFYKCETSQASILACMHCSWP